MPLSETELREFLIRNDVDCRSLKLLWEIDSGRVYGLTVNGAEAIDRWNYLRQLTDRSNYYPLLLGDDEEVERHQDSLEIPDVSIGEIIERGSHLNANDWFRDRAQEIYDDMCAFEELLGTVDDGDPIEAVTNSLLGEWEDDVPPNHQFRIPLDNSTVTIALIPTQTCWQVTPYLNFGNWNSCPAPEEHICLMKYWYEIYGAEVVGITGDIVEMRVAKPPLNQNDALSLAKEQYLYCNDIVDQGTQTLKILADILLEGSVWYFWWD